MTAADAMEDLILCYEQVFGYKGRGKKVCISSSGILSAEHIHVVLIIKNNNKSVKLGT